MSAASYLAKCLLPFHSLSGSFCYAVTEALCPGHAISLLLLLPQLDSHLLGWGRGGLRCGVKLQIAGVATPAHVHLRNVLTHGVGVALKLACAMISVNARAARSLDNNN